MQFSDEWLATGWFESLTNDVDITHWSLTILIRSFLGRPSRCKLHVEACDLSPATMRSGRGRPAWHNNQECVTFGGLWMDRIYTTPPNFKGKALRPWNLALWRGFRIWLKTCSTFSRQDSRNEEGKKGKTLHPSINLPNYARFEGTLLPMIRKLGQMSSRASTTHGTPDLMVVVGFRNPATRIKRLRFGNDCIVCS